MRRLVGTIYLLLQIALIVYGRLVPSRFFTWAPFQDVSRYEVQVVVGGRLLTPDEISDRYRMYFTGGIGVYDNPAQDVLYIVRQYEQTYGRKDGARVLLKYQVNGHEVKEWMWPMQ